MSFQLRTSKGLIGIAAALLMIGASAAANETQPLSLEGTWIMTSAYEILADGTRTTNYGERPHGLMMVDKVGHYSIQIFRPNRPKFASGDKRRGTPEEYREAVLGASTNTGRVGVDQVKGHAT